MNHLKFVVLSVLLLGLTACQSSHSPASTDKAPAPAVDATGRPGPAAQRSPRSGTLRLGDPADLYGTGTGRHLRITADAVVDPAVAVPRAPEPAAGLRRLGIELEAVNVGGAGYPATAGSVWIVDSAGARHKPVHSGRLTTGSPFVPGTLAAGDSVRGWLVFEVPDTARPVSLHYSTGVNSRGRTVAWDI